MDNKKLTPEQQRAKWRKEYAQRSTGHLFWESEDNTLVEWHNEIAAQRTRSLSARRNKRPASPPKPLKWLCTKCHKSFESPRALSTHMQQMHSGATHSPVRRPSIRTTIDFTAASPEQEEANAGAFPGTSTLSATARTTRIYTAAAPVTELCGKERRSNKNSDLGTSGTSARIVETPGELAILKCVVEGNPALKFAWKKGGREVPLTDDRLRCQTDGDTRTRKAKAPLNVPGPPGPPKPLHTAYNSITLQWARPLRDGGTPITGYELEKREHGTNAQWEKAAFGSVPDTQFKVTGVKQYHFYEFRVAAVNAVGQGEWSDNSVPIAATRSSCKPLITMGMLARENDLGSDSVDLRLEVVDRPAPPEGSETAGACPTIVINKEVSVQGPSVVPLKLQRANEKEKDATQIRTPKTAQPSSAHGIGPSLDSSDQPLSSTARRRESRRPKSARNGATALTPLEAMQCCSNDLPPPPPKNTERTASSGGRRRVGSTAADRPAQAAAAACAGNEEAPNEDEVADSEEEQQLLDMTTVERRRRHAMNPTQQSQFSDDGAGTSMTSDVSVQDYASSEFDLNAFLQICGQTEVQTWQMLGELSSFNKWSKIGEGAFGEVFKGTLENAPIAFKVIPFAASEEQCSKLVNGENLKPAKFIFNELYITNELSKLSAGNDFVTPTFIQLRMSKIIKGCFPSKLLKAWDAFKKAKPEKVENKRPDTYSEEGLHFLIIGLSYGGIDLKAYTIPNSHVCYSIFLQIALSLAVAERVLGFEHRDLHDENFLLEECAPDEKIRYKYDGAKIDVVSHGVRVSIIDYSISRLQKENVVVYADLSQDPGLFEQNGEEDGGDYQYDVYRMMKAAISDDGWASFCPQTNLYWLDYAAKKLFNNRFIRREKKEVIRRLFCPQYQNKFKTTRDFTVDPKFLTVFAKYISK